MPSSGEDIAEELRSFVLDKISSVSLLEVLLLLYSDPNKLWTASDLSRELRSSEQSAYSHLKELLAAQLVTEREGGYCFEAKQFEVLVSKLANLYRERRFSVIGLIYDKPKQRIQDLADAFILKKEDKNG